MSKSLDMLIEVSWLFIVHVLVVWSSFMCLFVSPRSNKRNLDPIFFRWPYRRAEPVNSWLNKGSICCWTNGSAKPRQGALTSLRAFFRFCYLTVKPGVPDAACSFRCHLHFFFQAAENESASKPEFQFCHCQILDSRLYAGLLIWGVWYRMLVLVHFFFTTSNNLWNEWVSSRNADVKRLFVPWFIYTAIFIIIYI